MQEVNTINRILMSVKFCNLLNIGFTYLAYSLCCVLILLFNIGR